MDHAQQSTLISSAVAAAIVLLVVGLRMRRLMQSRPLNPRNLWIAPGIVLVLTVLLLGASPPQGSVWLWIIGAFLVGAGLGWLRAKTIHLSIDPATGQVMAQGSALAVVFLLAILAGRYILRGVLSMEASAMGVRPSVIDACFLVMASGLLVARAVEMGVRARGLAPSAPTSPAR